MKGLNHPNIGKAHTYISMGFMFVSDCASVHVCFAFNVCDQTSIKL